MGDLQILALELTLLVVDLGIVVPGLTLRPTLLGHLCPGGISPLAPWLGFWRCLALRGVGRGSSWRPSFKLPQIHVSDMCQSLPRGEAVGRDLVNCWPGPIDMQGSKCVLLELVRCKNRESACLNCMYILLADIGVSSICEVRNLASLIGQPLVASWELQ